MIFKTDELTTTVESATVSKAPTGFQEVYGVVGGKVVVSFFESNSANGSFQVQDPNASLIGKRFVEVQCPGFPAGGETRGQTAFRSSTTDISLRSL